MLKSMRLSALLIFAAALPALADTRFQIRRMTRDDVPVGRGQCDIRLQVDNEVEVEVRGDMVYARTISGQDARDDGSECNAPLPNRDLQNFHYEVRDSHNDIRLLAEPSRRNGFAAIVRIRDGAGGFGRYHFRLTWDMTGTDYRRGPVEGPRREADFDAPRGGAGFAWNNTIAFRGKGRGEASLNNFGEMRLGEVNIEIDRGGRIAAWFRTDRGRPLSFNGSVIARDQGRWKADIVSDDRRLRGPMWFSVDEQGNVNTVTVEATDGRDRLRLNWDRR
jgi:hypothetical protein